MRLRAILFLAVACAGLGYGAHRIAVAAVVELERGAAAEAAAALEAAGEAGWAEVEMDGLIVTLAGAAPDETARARAAETLRRVFGAERVRDAAMLASAEPLAPPAFALEILRDEVEVSLIGLAPAESGREAVLAALAKAGLGAEVSDMLETVERTPPPDWAPALAFALEALADLRRAKIAVFPGRVEILAAADSAAEGSEIEARLEAARPEGVTLALEVSAPRPVIAPFVVDFALTAAGPRLAACAAESEADAAAIAAAAGAAPTACAVGLGAPTPDWAAASLAGIAAVRELGGGRFIARDLEARLTPPEGVHAGRFAAARAALAAVLPDPLALAAAPPAAGSADGGGAGDGAPEFAATLADDGTVTLAGPVRDALSQAAIRGYAAAVFGHGRVTDATVIADALPEGWPARVLTGVEALSLVKEGRLAVTEDGVAIEGRTLEADAAGRVRALLARKDVGAVQLALRFDAAAAAAATAAAAVEADPEGACADRVRGALAARRIVFRPGSAELEETGVAALDGLAAALAKCPPVAFEIAGHTDSQGRDAANLELSEARAEAVKAALDAAGLPHVRLTARGYGSERPIADNATEAGRAANRRIEFTLIRPAAPAGFAEPVVGPR